MKTQKVSKEIVNSVVYEYIANPEEFVGPLTQKDTNRLLRNEKISKSQLGIKKNPVSVKTIVGDIETTHKTLCDALRYYGFNVQEDWRECRKYLKAGHSHTMKSGLGVVVKFIQL